MCNVWKYKKKPVITSEDLEHIFKDKLFNKVNSVGISGGEPTLRADLEEICSTLCKVLPELKNISIITNGIEPDHIIRQLKNLEDIICKEFHRNLSIMISLDGVKGIHDANRGIVGNFNSSLKIMRYIRDNLKINISIGCTITKYNVWHVNELLEFAKQENIYIRFRIAEFINRLGNAGNVKSIRNFTRIERYNLSCFFYKLIYQYETNPTIKRTYFSILGILNGGKRKIGCPYPQKAIVLASDGTVYTCSPKSTGVGNALTESPKELYKKAQKEKKNIKQKYCFDCIHDYHAETTIQEFLINKLHNFWYKVYRQEFFPSLIYKLKKFKLHRKKNEVFIIGWYGTETVGDKAILGGIINYYQNKLGYDINIKISSLYPCVTLNTTKELKVKAEVVPVYSYDFIKTSANSEYIIMGGGPLMDLDVLFIPLIAFSIGKATHAKNIIHGCGIGTLNKEKHIFQVKKILSLSSEASFRDKTSTLYAKEKFNYNFAEYVNDPSIDYLKILQNSLNFNNLKRENILACFLREWPRNYASKFNDQEYQKVKDSFEVKLAENIITLCNENKLIPKFYSMHTFCIGNDDRDFNRNFVRKYIQNNVDQYYIEEKPSNVVQIMGAMLKSEFSICMRFHSVVFAETLDINYKAIDYTCGGKIYGFLKDRNKLEKLISLEDLADCKNIHFRSSN